MPDATEIVDPSRIEYSFPCIRATQPIGDIFIASIPFRTLIRISYFDVRRVLQADRDVERYLGIQRPLDDERVRSLSEYVTYKDASFPTSVILAVDEEFAVFDQDANMMKVSNFRAGESEPSIPIGKLAKVLDGQHRIAGLRAFHGETFDVPVTIFVGADIADQAQIFATVNLEQTKVHKSLVYDLFSLARTPSPQKTCHNIAVALDTAFDEPSLTRFLEQHLDSEAVTRRKVYTNYHFMLESAGVLSNGVLQPPNYSQRWYVDAVQLFWDRHFFDGNLPPSGTPRTLEEAFFDQEIYKLLNCGEAQARVFVRTAVREYVPTLQQARVNQFGNLRADGAIAA